jgi:hypothetical protein
MAWIISLKPSVGDNSCLCDGRADSAAETPIHKGARSGRRDGLKSANPGCFSPGHFDDHGLTGSDSVLGSPLPNL